MTAEKRKRGHPIGAMAAVPLPGLEAARLAAGLSKTAAGELIGLTKSHYGKIETGTVRLDVVRAVRLASLLGVTVESFVGESS